MATVPSSFNPANFIAAEYSHSGLTNLEAAPIDPSWIILGTSVARAKQLHPTSHGLFTLSPCGIARRVRSDGTSGTTRLYIFSKAKEVTVREDNGRERTLRAGDIAPFPRGATNVWMVNHYIRKVAINRFHPPCVVAFVKKSGTKYADNNEAKRVTTAFDGDVQ